MKSIILILDQVSDYDFNCKILTIINENDFTEDKSILIDRKIWELQGCE